MNEIILLLLFGAVCAAVTMVFMDRKEREKVAKDIAVEISVLREALKLINETHNQLALTQKNQAMDLGDVANKLEILIAGIPKERGYGR
jgi:hypothetical protein